MACDNTLQYTPQRNKLTEVSVDFSFKAMKLRDSKNSPLIFLLLDGVNNHLNGPANTLYEYNASVFGIEWPKSNLDVYYIELFITHYVILP